MNRAILLIIIAFASLANAAPNVEGASIFGLSGSNTFSLLGRPTDGAAAVGISLGSSSTLANATSKVLSIKNNASEVAYVGPSGQLTAFTLTTTQNTSTSNAINMVVATNICLNYPTCTTFLRGQAGGEIYLDGSTAGIVSSANVSTSGASGAFTAAAGNSGILSGSPADGPTAVGTILRASTNLANASAKLVSIRNNSSSEVAYFDRLGGLTSNSHISSGGDFITTNSGAFSAANGQSAIVFGRSSNGSSSIAINLTSVSNFSTAGAKVISVKNNLSNEIVAIPWEGGIQLNVQGTAEPTCTAARRGEIIYVRGGTGVAETIRACLKDPTDESYAWYTMVTST